MNQSQLNTPIVRFDRISKSFAEGDQQRHVLKEVNAEFYAGQFTAILGPSGSGKSTLLNLACGIEAPDTGDVFVGESAITRLNDHDRTLFRRDHIGFVFQFFNLISTLTVLENITLPQELAGKRLNDILPRAKTLLEQVGLADRAGSYPDKLSGGEQQRVAIARALAHDPAVLLADEPTGNLDAKTGTIVMDLLLSLTRQAGKTLIMATHSPEVVPFADRVLRVAGGQILEDSNRPSNEQPEAKAIPIAAD